VIAPSLWLVSLLLVTLLYLSLAVLYGTAQGRLARRYLHDRPRPPVTRWPSMDLVLPCYNEDPDVLARCCASLERLDYPGALRFFLVDDGSDNREALEAVYRRYQGMPRWTVIRQRHLGKRKAQAAAIARGRGELVVTIDSDTVLEADALRRLVPAFGGADVGAVTGDVRVLNRDHNWLTRLLDERYRLLFEQERAAQSQVGAVLCCAGPFSAYRRAAVEAVLAGYLRQRFLGQPCIAGDDIHLTNLVLSRGYRSLYEPSARALTIVPTRLGRYAHQQVRWNRSFYRELLPTLRAIRGRSLYLQLDVAARLLLPPLLAASVALAGIRLGQVRGLDLAPLALVALPSAGLLARKTARPRPDRHGLARPRPDRRFVVWYGLIYVLLLIPVRFWSLATLRGNGWLTRTVPEAPAEPAAEAVVA
jgi:N-acetylglucosaminyltransferase